MDSRSKTTEILINKLIVIGIIQSLTIALDTGASYYIYERKLSERPGSFLVSEPVKRLLSIVTNSGARSISFAISTYGSTAYISGLDGKCGPEDMNSIFTNSPWLLLHFSNTLLRIAEMAIV